MGNKRNRRSRRQELLSPGGEENRNRADSSETGNITSTKSNLNVEETSGESYLEHRLVEPSQISNEIRAWTEIFEQMNDDRKSKMREEMENKPDAILKKINQTEVSLQLRILSLK